MSNAAASDAGNHGNQESANPPPHSDSYLVVAKRGHPFLMAMAVLGSYALWTCGGAPLVPPGGGELEANTLLGMGTPVDPIPPVSEWAMVSTQPPPTNLYLMLARATQDVRAKSPANMWDAHVHRHRFKVMPAKSASNSGAMHCGGSCSCQGVCHCAHDQVMIAPQPTFTTLTHYEVYGNADYALAYLYALIPLAYAFALLGQRSAMVLSASGIAFGLGMLKKSAKASTRAGKSRRVAWSDIAGVKFSEKTEAMDDVDRLAHGAVDFNIATGRLAQLDLKSLKPSDLRALHDGLQAFAPPEIVSPELIKSLTSAIPVPASEKSDAQAEDLSFTSMWEKDLGAHMGATTFVPLSRGATLQSGRLKVVALLASGGLSAVYLAERAGGELVILKESVVPQHVDDKAREKARQLFEREARLLLKLDHPQIAKVADHIVENGRDYLVLQYIAGQSLRQLVKRVGAQEEKLVVKWAGQIASILQYLHELDPTVVHRDLTPDNIVLREDGSIALIDFGAANEYIGAATGTLIGKQSYISPEQFRGKSSPSSDIYALGCTLNFLLTGRDPEALSVSHPREQRSEISEAMDKLVADLTALEEGNRIASAVDLQSRLAEL